MTFEEWFESEGFENDVSDKAVMYGGCLLTDCWNAAQQAEREKHQALIAAAEAVIERWETPLWKEAKPTAVAVYRMLDVLERMKRNEN